MYLSSEAGCQEGRVRENWKAVKFLKRTVTKYFQLYNDGLENNENAMKN